MQKSGKPAAGKPKKSYATPKLATHGDVRKLTQKRPGGAVGPPSHLFGNNGHGDK